ncbi:O-phosphoseryl-tRNA(Sec) selenium transferase [Promethearchaeum syntrophicum]|uniref:O-phosphoseryl-tRNA(Sec) selenium transferase n=1 Tax=Promethearchaeum syntrophicum TaxID=2594042 RepID=A0A5B9D5F9_9ARCH|nr:O-phosphoseryl-tRNA(Sec) selenium transferase [Candidatus Prometheoarchaeum syntrophicum]QEE14339.1 O-phosphoseryl-tRNA(Sec) selenium transferase [Candidatus Prometheoarchaeum syntrophicum]
MWKKEFFDSLENLGVPSHMLKRSSIGFKEIWKPIMELFQQRKIPEHGWNDFQIRQLLDILSHLDSDKDPRSIRIGEREGRISSVILNEISGGFCHGIGRSGELTAAQPKAAGASLMQNLTNIIVLSLIKSLGLPNIKTALTIPFGTGMSIGMAMRGALNYHKIDIHEKPMVLMTQIDHKSPRKGIEYIGGILKIIPGRYGKNYYSNEGVFTNIEEIKEIYHLNSNKISAIISSTCFFAPRVPDNIKEIAKFAKKNEIIHIINNAYGLQTPALLKLIRQSIDAGRIDAIVQSTDKNFLTPVGGAVITSPNTDLIKEISKSYAGRASASPVVQLLVSLLSMGKQGYLSRIEFQKENRTFLEDSLLELANEFNEQIIECNNPVSCAMSLKNIKPEKIQDLGGILYNLRVTGPRIINIHKDPFGSCTTEMKWPYVVMNAAIGVEKKHIFEAVDRLKRAIKQVK